MRERDFFPLFIVVIEPPLVALPVINQSAWGRRHIVTSTNGTEKHAGTDNGHVWCGCCW